MREPVVGAIVVAEITKARHQRVHARGLCGLHVALGVADVHAVRGFHAHGGSPHAAAASGCGLRSASVSPLTTARARRLRRPRRYRQAAPSAATGAVEGDYVVHLDHGIGIYRGIETDHRGRVDARGRDRGVRGRRPAQRAALPARPARAVPRGRRRRRPPAAPAAPAGRLVLAAGAREDPPGDQADGGRAARPLRPADASAGGYAFPPDTRWQRELESSFLYEDTPDQRKATEEVKRDMERPRPMDRLLVGDVGYGKTEVAVRAAFKAVQGGKQVAVLVPTTILAEQHGRTFIERLADFPVKIEVLSRFRTAKEQKAALERLAAGQIDIVIGTHRLLSKDVAVQGPRAAGRGRGAPLRREAQGAAQGAPAVGGRADAHRHADSPDAPPLARRAARPHPDRDAAAGPLADPHLRRAVGRCAARGGVRPGDSTAAGRCSWSTTGSRPSRRSRPGCSRSRRGPGSGVAHGQMAAEELEEVMRRFVAGEVDILVSTMIVESGLDVPNANTMVVHDAHRFGLAQLYQLRGRVGRSHRRAYCYLLVPDTIDADAEERLKVLEHHTDLGRGLPDRAQGPRAPGRRQPARAPSSRGTRRRWASTSTCGGWRRRCRRSGGRAATEQPAAAGRGARPAGAPAGRVRAGRRRQARSLPATGAGCVVWRH